MAEREVQISAKLHKGMPDVKASGGEKPRLELDESLVKRIAESQGKGKISISLESLDVDLQHNQSFGMMQASTGCISNPGGPSC